jgi:hypothetical protein
MLGCVFEPRQKIEWLAEVAAVVKPAGDARQDRCSSFF